MDVVYGECRGLLVVYGVEKLDELSNVNVGRIWELLVKFGSVVILLDVETAAESSIDSISGRISSRSILTSSPLILLSVE